MISTRENLLIRPWQQRKYEYHKKKVLLATPVIDTKSPPFRGHVALKLKKLQKENERTEKIERDNLILLQKLRHIMTTHWSDNYLAPQPTFLSRVGVYRPVDSGIDLNDFSKSLDFDEVDAYSKPKCRKEKCLACGPIKYVESIKIPEERVPWEPQKAEITKRRSRSVPSRIRPERDHLSTIPNKPKTATTFIESKKLDDNAKGVKKVPSTDFSKNCISLSRGSLKLDINFPSDANVKFDLHKRQNKICRCSRGMKN
ncbi:uncharacterized protein LOC126736310 [Anthonomus grandis grandis]|uniref:uncharacterized protein LOC126736310 n=1 Tax=Anthonomus grandis grandis TaxID=2921223 RepID=UPI002166204C|nr:uncharacterized protein LOC126736310 [Anthonomus grandis grandis]